MFRNKTAKSIKPWFQLLIISFVVILMNLGCAKSASDTLYDDKQQSTYEQQLENQGGTSSALSELSISGDINRNVKMNKNTTDSYISSCSILPPQTLNCAFGQSYASPSKLYNYMNLSIYNYSSSTTHYRIQKYDQFVNDSGVSDFTDFANDSVFINFKLDPTDNNSYCDIDIIDSGIKIKGTFQCFNLKKGPSNISISGTFESTKL